MHYYCNNTIVVVNKTVNDELQGFRSCDVVKKVASNTFSTLAMNITITSEFPKFLVLSTLQSQHN